LKPADVAFVCRVVWRDNLGSRKSGELPISIVLRGDDGKIWEIQESLKSISTINSKKEKAPFKVLRSIEISVRDDFPAEIFLDDIGLSRE
jgi:hypothetical protein